MIDKNKDLLPIGSVVLLKNAKKRLMISGYLALIGNNEYYDYVGNIYPEGFISSDTTALFNKEDIDRVYSIGFADGETLEYLKFLKEQFNEVKANSTLKKAQTNVDYDFEKAE